MTETSDLIGPLDYTSWPVYLELSPATKLLNILRLIWTKRGVRGLDDFAESRGALLGIWVFFIEVGTFWPAVFLPTSFVFDRVDTTSSRGSAVNFTLLLVEICVFWTRRFSELYEMAFSALPWLCIDRADFGIMGKSLGVSRFWI